MPETSANLVARDVVLILTITVPEVRGDEPCVAIERAFTAAVDQSGATKVVVDCRGVSYMNSAGFRALLGLYHKLKGAGGRVVLCGLTDMVSEVLHVLRFVDASGGRPAPFEVQPDLAAAVVSLLGPESVAEAP
jgi:anti-anti-sigma regulatory factor